MGTVHEGLNKVISDVPLRSTYLELAAGASSLGGVVARLEGGARPLGPLSLYAFTEWTPHDLSAGAGVRAQWDF